MKRVKTIKRMRVKNRTVVFMVTGGQKTELPH